MLTTINGGGTTMDYLKELELLCNMNNGYIRTSQIESIGIKRPTIRKLIEKNILEKISNGIYVLSGDLSDEYALFQSHSSIAVFSHGTALFLWGLSDRVPHSYDVTVPQGTNVSHLKRDYPDINCHYVKTDVYYLGITTTKTPQGAIVKLYDRERCICDLVKNREKSDSQLYSQAINDFFKLKTDSRKLLNYSKALKIEEDIRTYMEVLQ